MEENTSKSEKNLNSKLEELKKKLQASKKQNELLKQKLKDTGNNKNIDFTNNIHNELEKKYINFTNEMIISLDLAGTITYCNRSVCKNLGYEADELIGKNWFSLNAPEGLEDKLLKNFKEQLNNDEFISIENRVRCKNGDIKIIQWHDTILKDDNNKKIGLLSFGKDISELNFAHQQIKQQNKMQHILINLAARFINAPLSEVSYRINLSLRDMGSFIKADRAYIFDYDWENEIAINTYEWCAEGISPEIDNLQAVPLSEMTEWVKSHKKGEKVLIKKVSELSEKEQGLRDILEPQGIKSLISLPLMSKDNCIGFIGFDSVKNHKIYSQIEESLLLVFSKMLVNIFERKKIEKNLKKALEKAKESDRLKSAFLANMSHEIRTPMNGIIGFTNLLKKPKLSGEKQEKYIGIIEKSGKRMLNTINDIIDISKIEAGQVELVESTFFVNDLLIELYQFFNEEANVKGLEFVLSIENPDSKSGITTDRAKLESILTNLIKNAIKFTHKGKIAIGYELNEVEEKYNFFVKDTGIGIPENRIKAIFNRFEQADIEDRMALEGSGLGLAISKSYVQMLGGTISVTSEEEKGSHFKFTIPFSTKSLIIKSNGLQKETISRNEFRNLTILIAEDDETNILLFENILSDSFKKLLFAKNGQETITTCQMHPEIDLILMDIKMPFINGFEATKQIRKFNKDVIIIAQTAYGIAGDREKAFKVGCNEYIGKPIIKEDLFKIIKNLINSREL